MLDMILRQARLVGRDDLVDIGMANGRIVAVDGPAQQTIDLEGAFITPALVEPHIHLDAVLTVGQPRYNMTGSLFEGIAIWGERTESLSVADIIERARQVLHWQIANGVLHVRSHVDVSDPQLRAVRALTTLREELRDRVDLQLVAFPQQGIYTWSEGERLMKEAVTQGIDVIGGIPHFELTREHGVKSVEFVMELAAEHGLRVDIHCDETDDDHSRFVEVMAAETMRLGLSGRVTASHTTAMHSYNGAYAYRLIQNIKRAGLHMVTNPLDNAVLQGRFDSYPVRRGYTRIKELLAAGVNVCLGHDSVMDPWYPLGKGDPVQAAFVLAHYGQMSGYDELHQLVTMITSAPARALGLEGYGLEVGAAANLVVFDAPTAIDVIRLMAPRRYVFRQGRLVARTAPAQTTLFLADGEKTIDFLPA